jgi:hypothetical protein
LDLVESEKKRADDSKNELQDNQEKFDNLSE